MILIENINKESICLITILKDKTRQYIIVIRIINTNAITKSSSRIITLNNQIFSNQIKEEYLCLVIMSKLK